MIKFFLLYIIDVNGKNDNVLGKSRDTGVGNNNKNNKKINEDIYNINNFCSSTVKIREKSLYQNVVVPKFEELEDDFFEDNCIEVSFYYNLFINYFRTMKTLLMKPSINFMTYSSKKKLIIEDKYLLIVIKRNRKKK